MLKMVATQLELFHDCPIHIDAERIETLLDRNDIDGGIPELANRQSLDPTAAIGMANFSIRALVCLEEVACASADAASSFATTEDLGSFSTAEAREAIVSLVCFALKC
ncbi:hypothetical protein ABGT18_04735 [Pseudomonas putida]|uniref:hypothetical protein n=1 Tax=Pseudomonas putida TaxID=303 RepID=UPI00345CEE15